MQQNNDTLPFTNIPNAALILENKKVFWGNGLGAKTAKIGELCFNTSQTGYQEILTDPSYAKQIITFTFPHIGIVGINDLDLESKKIYASGCIINQESEHHSNWRSNSDINSFFLMNNIPCITNIDTRQLTRMLSSNGAMKAAIIHFEEGKENFEDLKIKLNEWSGLENLDLATFVSTANSYHTTESVWDLKKNRYANNDKSIYNISCIDFGIKKNILRNLNKCNFFDYSSSSKFIFR